ncbi:MAG: class I SAM-dependent methyltransferase [Acidobacteriota bacterium]
MSIALDTEPTLVRFRDRLAQFRRGTGDADDWERQWQRRDVAAWLASHADGRLGPLEPMASALPRDGKILEAGCGVGQVVVALRARGFDAEGVDYAHRTIERIRIARPDLPVRQGDVYALDVPDGHYAGYVSIGVFEHHPDGPTGGLREARRVLRHGGIAIITVPMLNAARRRRLASAPAVERTELEDGRRFYQFYLEANELAETARTVGLEPIAHHAYGTFAGLTRDLALGRFLEARHFFSWRLRDQVLRLSRRLPQPIARRYAHMLMLICRAA